MLDYLSTVPAFLVYLGTGGLMLVAFMAVYLLATPQRELTLIRHGNMSAGLVFSGTLLGVALPIASAMAHSVNLWDLVSWCAVAGAVQIVVSLVLRVLIHDLRAHIEADRTSVAIVMASMKVAAGLLNAAAMVY